MLSAPERLTAGCAFVSTTPPADIHALRIAFIMLIVDAARDLAVNVDVLTRMADGAGV